MSLMLPGPGLTTRPPPAAADAPVVPPAPAAIAPVVPVMPIAFVLGTPPLFMYKSKYFLEDISGYSNLIKKIR